MNRIHPANIPFRGKNKNIHDAVCSGKFEAFKTFPIFLPELNVQSKN